MNTLHEEPALACAPAAPPALTPLRVLVVEDSEDDALLVIAELRRGAFEPRWMRVETAETMAAALAQQPWDVILADYEMPHFSGPAALKLVREARHDLPFIMVSGTIGEEVAVAMMRAGAHDYVMKTNLTRLSAAVARELRDAEERRLRSAAEVALRDSEARFQAFMDHSPAVAFIKDDAGRYVYVSSAFERFFQTTMAATRGKTDDDLWPAAVAQRIRENDEVVLSRNQAVELTETVPTTDGLVRDWVVLKFPITDAGGQRFIGGVAVDVTDRKLVEARVQALEKLAQQRARLADIGAITAQIVHDLGNPLAGLAMQAQLILHRAKRDPNQPLSSVTQAAERIVGEVFRLDSLIKEFMDFSREQRLELKPLQLSRFLREVVSFWRPVAAARRIDVALDVPRNLPQLLADEEKLRRVFENLVKNAVEAIEMGPGRIHIAVSQPAPQRIRISVADDGPGIPETVQVFRLFETTKRHGTGLGLAIAKQIVLAHGGDIAFERVKPHGTVFHVELQQQAPGG
ncbi:MAG: PAS domain-containing protein [Deltaproteobacteria bacterium]|nr:PAS domain-containing protein [Deltaproteobacteria bacterium]